VDNPYVQLTAEVAAADADAASSLLRTLADGGAWIETPFTQRDVESPAVAVKDAPVRIHVYLRGTDAEANATLGRMALTTAGIDATVTVRDVDEEDWAESWKEHFHIERFGEHVVVVPTWRSYDADPGDAVVTLDPGMAFGTGQHETTRMCIESLECAMVAGARVLDVGCGSGILSLAAAKLGGGEVVGVDIDEMCVRVTAENARTNGVEHIVHVARGSLGEAWPFADTSTGQFDVVVANIIARTIVELAQPLVDALFQDGRLIVSGVIEEREAEVRAALGAAGARIDHIRSMGDWRCIEASPSRGERA
jgi:ribosomal protein L11 methyltransferase